MPQLKKSEDTIYLTQSADYYVVMYDKKKIQMRYKNIVLNFGIDEFISFRRFIEGFQVEDNTEGDIEQASVVIRYKNDENIMLAYLKSEFEEFKSMLGEAVYMLGIYITLNEK